MSEIQAIEAQIKCPRCRGWGGYEAFVNRGWDIEEHSIDFITCEMCHGAIAAQIKCPRCRGWGGYEAFVNHGWDIEEHSIDFITCEMCHGRAVISAERAKLVEKGARIKAARIAKRQTILTAALELGIRPSELSRIECGLAPAEAYERFSDKP